MPAQLGRYQIKQQLGSGGMGAVYLAEDLKLHREVALKVPSFDVVQRPDLLARFFREAEATAKFDHPNLCQILDVDCIDGIHFLAMPYIPGKPLATYTGKPIVVANAIEVVLILAKALAYAHNKGVLHRDLKPGNVIVKPGVGPVVLDFGLARSLSTAMQGQNLTQYGTAMGTPWYMAPEQMAGDLSRLGPATDVYSLGIIFYELLTGRVPYKGNNLAAVCALALTTQPIPPSQLRPEIPPELDAICLKAFARDIRERYQSMSDFAAALTAYQEGHRPPIVPRPLGTPPPPTSANGAYESWLQRRNAPARPSKIREVLLWLAVLVGIGVLLALVILW